MPKIFVSYRRSDSREEAVRIADAAMSAFGEDSVFFDTSTMAAGEAFPHEIESNIKHSTHMLVVIGPDWMAKDPETGLSRVEAADDWVRREVRLGLGTGSTLIPVLVNHGQLPAPDELPADLRPMLNRNAVELPPGHFSGHLNPLIDRLRDRSALLAALVMLIASVIAGISTYMIEGIMRALEFAITAIRNSENLNDQTRTTASQILETGILSKFTTDLLGSFNVSVSYALVGFGALIAARGFTRIGSEHVFPSVVLGFILCFFSLIPTLFLTKVVDAVIASNGFAEMIIFESSGAAGFVLGALMPLRRPLKQSTTQVLTIAGIAWISVVLVSVVFFLISDFMGFENIYMLVWFATCFNWVPAEFMCHFSPVNLMDILELAVVVLLAISLLDWQISFVRLASAFLVLTIYSMIVVLGLSFVEVVVLETEFFSNMVLPRGLLFAGIVFWMARWGIARSERSEAPSSQA